MVELSCVVKTKSTKRVAFFPFLFLILTIKYRAFQIIVQGFGRSIVKPRYLAAIDVLDG